jgi:hypothetical protein
MKAMWKKVIMLIIALAIIAFSAFPIRFAVKKESLVGRDYLICQIELVTGFSWIAVESSYGYEGFVKLQGNLPLDEYRNYYPRVRFNKFICYGEIIGEGEYDGYEYKIFRVDSWDVLYPITRHSTLPDFLLPKSWLVLFDVY